LGAAAKWRVFRECGPREHLLLVYGVLVIDGAIEKFSEYECEYVLSRLQSSLPALQVCPHFKLITPD
jgi:hypothetical protein